MAVMTPCCRHEEKGESVIVARVGDGTLTLEEAKAHIDTSRSPVAGELEKYVSHWVNAELVYQEARRQGIESSDQFIRQVQDVRKQLASEEFLNRMIYAGSDTVGEQGLRAFHSQHASEFQVHQDMIKANVLIMKSRELASRFAATVSQGMQWKIAVDYILRDSVLSPGILLVATEKYYTQQTLFTPELWKVASALGPNEVSFPLKAPGGYFVLQSLAKIRQGSIADFDLARDEIRQRLLMEKRRQRYEELLGTLRARYNVQIVLPSQRSPDSLQNHE